MRSIHTFLVLLSLCLSFTASAQQYIWAKGEGGVGNDAAFGIAADNSGNCYVTGNIAGSADFSGTVYQGRNLFDVFIAKYDAAGNVAWVVTAGGTGNDQANAIVLSNNLLYICGYFEDTAYFGSYQLISKGQQDAFVACYNLSGQCIWAAPAGGSGTDVAKSLALDANDNVFVVGNYETSINIGGTQLSTANFFNESFVAAYNSNGNLLWARSSQGNNANQFTDIACDADNNLCISGFFGGAFIYGNSTLQSQGSSYDILILKLDNNGDMQWAKRAGSNLEDAANAIATDRDGNIIITGYFTSTAYFDARSVTYRGYNDVFTAKYDAAGNNLWVLAGKGIDLDIGYDVTTDTAGNIFVTGMFQSQINFDDNIINGTDRDPFVISYSPNGVIRWFTSGGGGNTEAALALDVNAQGTVFFAGYYLYFCRFGNIELGNANFNDLFVAVYQPPVVSGVDDESLAAIILYPNPAQQTVCVNNTNVTEIRLYNMEGKLLQQATQTNCMNLKQIPAGLYITEVVTPKGTGRTMLSVQHP